jgi:integrase
MSKTAPYQANRMAAVVSKMFAYSMKLKQRTDNPVKGLERNDEERRERFLSPAEIGRLTDALANLADQRSADAIRLLILTGARKGEVLSADWNQFDLEAGVWTKPSAHTKQKKIHRVPLSAPALQLLTNLRDKAEEEANKAREVGMPAPASSRFVFPGDSKNSPLTDIKKSWAAAAAAAGLKDVRIHDLRHTFASILVSAGQSLPLIGGLLGHTQPATTARYAHLYDDPLRAATERVGVIVGAAGRKGADVVPLQKGGR